MVLAPFDAALLLLSFYLAVPPLPSLTAGFLARARGFAGFWDLEDLGVSAMPPSTPAGGSHTSFTARAARG